VGGLLRLKTPLYWYGGRGCDGTPGRVSPILAVEEIANTATEDARTTNATWDIPTDVLLLIDGVPRWVWVGKLDVELL